MMKFLPGIRFNGFAPRQMLQHKHSHHVFCPAGTLAETDKGHFSHCRKKSKTVVWDEANLEYNDSLPKATMKIVEPDTPWASPTREPFSDDGRGIPLKPSLRVLRDYIENSYSS